MSSLFPTLFGARSLAVRVLSCISLLSIVPSVILSPGTSFTENSIASSPPIFGVVFEIFIPTPHVIFDVSSKVYVPSHDACHTSCVL